MSSASNWRDVKAGFGKRRQHRPIAQQRRRVSRPWVQHWQVWATVASQVRTCLGVSADSFRSPSPGIR
jgi:hypothetical protein